MIYVSGQYVSVILILDTIMLTTALVFRKPKHKSRTLTQDLRLSKHIGYYLVISAIMVLVLGHYAFYMSLVSYLEGLLIDSFLFYFGLRTVTGHE